MSLFQSKKPFYINSGNQLTDTVNSFTVNLDIPEQERFNRCVLMQANIPISYYMISEGNNTFTLREGALTSLITIPIANYNALSYRIVLSALLTAGSPNGLTYTISLPSNDSQANTGKYTFTANSILYDISFEFPPGSAIVEEVGFDTSSTVSFTKGVDTSTLVSKNVLYFIPEGGLFILSSLCDNGENNVLQEIYSQSSVNFGSNSWTNPCPDAYSKKLSSQSKAVTFTFVDNRNNPVYFNGIPVLFTIMLYRENNIYDKIGAACQIYLESVKNNS